PRRPGTGGGRSAGAGGRAGARIPTRPGSGRSCRSLVGSFLELGGAVGVGAVAVDQFVFVRGGRAVSPPRPGGGVDVAAARPVVDDSGDADDLLAAPAGHPIAGAARRSSASPETSTTRSEEHKSQLQSREKL